VQYAINKNMSLKKLLELNAKYAGGQNYLMKKYGLGICFFRNWSFDLLDFLQIIHLIGVPHHINLQYNFPVYKTSVLWT
jgi:hypothetical protein